MNPVILFVVLVAVAMAVFMYRNPLRARRASTRFLLEIVDAAFFGYLGYLAITLVFNFSEFTEWKSALRILFFVPPLSTWQTIAVIGGFATGVTRFKQGPGMDYKDKREYAGGRRILSHRSALKLANALLAKRTAEVNRDPSNKEVIHLPQHMDPAVYYDGPEEEELDKVLPLEDVETNPALKPYVSEPDEFATVAWGGIRLPMEEARKHCLVVGGTGSGKTLMIHALMKSVLPQITRKGDFRAFIYDDKLDFLPFARQLGIEEYIWNLDPYAEKSVAWDIAADVDSQEAARQVADALSPVDPQQNQKYFDRAAQQLLAAAMIRFRERCGTKWTLRDLLLACINRAKLEKFLEGSKDVWVLEATSNLLSPRDSTADVMGTLTEKLMPYAPIAALWTHATRKVSIKEWHRTNAILLTVMRQGCSVALKPINQALFRLASAYLVDDSRRDRQTWVFLDEVREIGKLQGLTALTNKGREKGVRVVMGFQTIEGLQAEWGSKEAGNEAANICSNRIFLHSDSAETCGWMAQHVGSMELDETIFQHSHSVSRDGASISKSWSTQRHTRPSMHPSDFDENLKPASPEYGITAVNICPAIGTYVSWMPWSWVLKHLPKPPDVEEKMRPPEAQELKPWDERDCDRLKLSSEFLTGGEKDADSESGKAKPSNSPDASKTKKEKNRRLWDTSFSR